jgi:hypothetical protein
MIFALLNLLSRDCKLKELAVSSFSHVDVHYHLASAFGHGISKMISLRQTGRPALTIRSIGPPLLASACTTLCPCPGRSFGDQFSYT